MEPTLDRTSWRGMQIDHPHDWELSVASGVDEPGRLKFVDRLYERLDVRWKPLTYVPDLQKALEKYRPDADRKAKVSDLSGAPQPWQGIVRKLPKGTVVHAGRFFRNVRWLVEATVLWPRRRNTELERTILASVQPLDPRAPVLTWQASGLSLVLGREFDLQTNQARVGRVAWTFTARAKGGPELTVERLAMAQYWLRQPLRDWLVEELPDRHEVIRQHVMDANGHRGEALISRGRVGRVASLRGLKEIRLDAAWQCPLEARVYHVRLKEISRDEEISLPQDLQIRCCRAVPAPAGSEAQT